MKNGSWITVLVLTATTARAQETFELVSATPAGALGNSYSTYPKVSGDGRFVVFGSNASDLVAGDTNGAYDVFVRDLDARTTERVSVTSTDGQIAVGAGNGSGSLWAYDTPQISRDGSLVAFSTDAADVVPGDTNGAYDAFLRDRVAGTTTRISVDSNGGELNGASGAVQMSADGQRYVFAHRPSGASFADLDWYMHDRTTGTTQLVSIAPDGAAIRRTWSVRFAAGGRHVLIQAVNPTNGNYSGTFVRDIDLGVTSSATPGSGWRGFPWSDDLVEIEGLAISANGRFVLCSAFDDLDPDDGVESQWEWNAWVLDRSAATFRLATRIAGDPDTDWAPTVGSTFQGQSYVSDDGRIARFSASSPGLVGLTYDDDATLYEVDTVTSETRVLSLDWRVRPLRPYANYSHLYSASDDGLTVVMQALPRLHEGFPFPLDNEELQLLVRRVTSSAGTTVCAGDGTGAGCPCGAAGIRGRGCANAFTDRGSVLRTRGNASIGDDSLTLLAYDEPYGTSLLLQSAAAAPNGGVPFDGGVLCVSTPALRIAMRYPWADNMGSVKLFGFGASLARRMHEIGGVWTPGTRYYQVWTRAVGGTGCLAGRSSLTNGVRVEWRL